MRMIPQPEMGFFYIAQQKLAEEIEKGSPFRGKIPTKEDIRAYLNHVHGMLVERRDSPGHTAREYLTALSIYSFVRPLVRLDIPPSFPNTFVRIAQKSPYSVDAPLDIIFRTADAEDDALFETHNRITMLLSIEDVMLDPRAVFSRSEHIKHELVESLRQTTGILLSKYTPEGHFTFVGMYDVCFPLFGIPKKNASHNRLADALRKHYGAFNLKSPLCFSDFLAPTPEHKASG